MSKLEGTSVLPAVSKSTLVPRLEVPPCTSFDVVASLFGSSSC